MTNRPEQPDEELARSLATSLDESLGSIDELSLARLKQARTKALQQPGKFGRKWIALGAAASLAALLLAPVFWQQQVEADSDVVAVLDIPPSSEELDDLDMLLALEDGDA